MNELFNNRASIELKTWDIKTLKKKDLPDVPQIMEEVKTEVMAEQGKSRFIVGGIVAGIGLLIGIIGGVLLMGILAVVGFAAGFLTKQVMLASHIEEIVKTKIMPQIAKACGGEYHEDADAVLPWDSPELRSYEKHESMGTKAGLFKMVSVGNTNKNDKQSGKRGGGSSWLELGDAITGTLPNSKTKYGIAKVTKCSESTDSDGHTSVNRANIMVCWLDIMMPIHSLEIKKRAIRGGIGRMFDKLDSKFTDQETLDLESEEFNSKFKVEVADGADSVLVRRMFSPKVMDAFTSGKVTLRDPVLYRDGRAWASDAVGTGRFFKPKSVIKEIDYMLTRTNKVAEMCKYLASEVNHDIDS